MIQTKNESLYTKAFMQAFVFSDIVGSKKKITHPNLISLVLNHLPLKGIKGYYTQLCI